MRRYSLQNVPPEKRKCLRQSNERLAFTIRGKVLIKYKYLCTYICKLICKSFYTCKDICIWKEIRLCLVSTAFDFSLAGKAFLRSGGGGWSEEGTCTLFFLEKNKTCYKPCHIQVCSVFYGIIEKQKSYDGGDSIEAEVVRMNVLTKSVERSSLLSAYETIQTILGFGMFTIALIGLIVTVLKNDKKK